jgi:hypothetical protein
MRHGVLRSAIITLAVTLVSAAPLLAQSKTSLSGALSGRELCEQAVCGSAIFVAAFGGQIDHRPAVGLAIGAIRHTALPTAVHECATIVGGSWSINTLRRNLSGSIEYGGTVCYIDGIRYLVSLTMNIGEDGSDGQAQLTVLLDHEPFPPTVKGTISQ